MTNPETFTVLDGGPTADDREERLNDGAAQLVEQRSDGSIVGRDHFLLAVAGALMALGVIVILIGWSGAANSILVEEQVPYLISGGLLGVALSTIGALTFFSYWLTVAIRDNRKHEAARRRDHTELMAALQSLAGKESAANGSTRSGSAPRSVRRSPRSR